MAPGTNIGAAHPVEGTGQDVKGDMGEKVTNDTAALVRAQATLRGRNVSLAEELVRKSSSLSAQEAQKAKLVEIIAQDLPDLLQQLNGRTVIVEGNLQKVLNTRDLDLKDLVTLPMSLGHTFLHHLANPNISTMLMAIGGAAIYVEVSSGFALVAPGIFGLLCLLLAFISLQLLPINIGGVLLFLVGAVLLIAEAFFTSFGLLAASGIASLILGALFLIDLKVSFLTLGPLIGAIAVVVFFTAYLLARDRKKVSKNFDPIIGHHGKVETVNSDGRSGKLFIKGEIWDFESPEPVTKGLKVKVAGKHNLVLHIEKA
jgi:membrane-bound serine protease (ClpP class)